MGGDEYVESRSQESWVPKHPLNGKNPPNGGRYGSIEERSSDAPMQLRFL